MSNPMNERIPGIADKPSGGESHRRPGDDLVWTAYQYTADELPEPAARAFEALLETDQQAREALAEAVSLADTIRASLSPDATPAPAVMPASLVASSSATAAVAGGSFGWVRSIAWVALGAAACLALTMALRSKPAGDGLGAGGMARQTGVNSDAQAAKTDLKVETGTDHQLLAVLFPEGSAHDAASADVVGIVATAGSPDAAVDAHAVLDDEAYEPMPEAVTFDTAAPDWLLAAVAEAGQ